LDDLRGERRKGGNGAKIRQILQNWKKPSLINITGIVRVRACSKPPESNPSTLEQGVKEGRKGKGKKNEIRLPKMLRFTKKPSESISRSPLSNSSSREEKTEERKEGERRKGAVQVEGGPQSKEVSFFK